MMQIISNAMLWSNLQEQSSSNEFTFLCFLGNHQRAWQTKCKMFTLALSRRNDCLIFWFEDSNNFFTFDQIYLIPIFLMADIFDLKLKESKQSWSHLIKCETSLQHLQGVLDRLAASFAPSKGGDEEEEIRWGSRKLEDSLNFQAENPRLVPPAGGSASKPGFAGEADQEETVGSDQVVQTFLTNWNFSKLPCTWQQ